MSLLLAYGRQDRSFVTPQDIPAQRRGLSVCKLIFSYETTDIEQSDLYGGKSERSRGDVFISIPTWGN